MAVYNIVDAMFIAWIGTEATGATQVVLPLMMLSTAIGLTFGIGGGSYLSRLLGRKQMKEAEKLTSTAFFTALLVGAGFTIAGILLIEPILTFFGASTPEVMALSKSYGIFILAGSVFLINNMVMNNFLRAEGSAKLSMIGMALGALLNIILDPIFIFVFKWGIAGAAIATSISQGVTFIILLSAYLRKKTIIRLRIKSYAPSKTVFKEILIVGTPTFFKQLLFSVSMALMNQSAGKYGGPDLLAAVSVVVRTTFLPTNIIFGLGQGLQPVAGFNIGAGNTKRVMSALKYSLGISTAVMAVSGLFTVLLAPQIMGIFKTAPHVSDLGIRGLRYYSAGLLFLGVTNTITVFYQALGRGKESLILSISRQGIFFIPVILFLPRFLGINGVLSAQLIADLISVILSILILIPFIKKREIDQEVARHKNETIVEGAQ